MTSCTCPICTEREALADYIIGRLNDGADPEAVMEAISTAEFQVVDDVQVSVVSVH